MPGPTMPLPTWPLVWGRKRIQCYSLNGHNITVMSGTPKPVIFIPAMPMAVFRKNSTRFYLPYLDEDKEYTDDYVEGTALQWRWAPFFDAAGLTHFSGIRLISVEELNHFFENRTRKGTLDTRLILLAWQRTRYSCVLICSTLQAGPTSSQKWGSLDSGKQIRQRVRRNEMAIMTAGTLSAWYVFSSLGFYPVAGSECLSVSVRRCLNKATIKWEKTSSKSKQKISLPKTDMCKKCI
ncbi:MAG: glycoside hydrolase family 92 protein [Cyclobacteriaceae bacterium]|nr:glycoside hydrolase family 92 protein [Cyclobacteriaceae bacterium]